MVVERRKTGGCRPQLSLLMSASPSEPERRPPPQSQVRVEFASGVKMQKLPRVPVENRAVQWNEQKGNECRRDVRHDVLVVDDAEIVPQLRRVVKQYLSRCQPCDMRRASRANAN